MDMAVIPPFRFSCVEHGLYRSAHPTPRNYPFLRQLKLKTIVCFLSSLDPSLEAFAQAEKISLILVHVERSFEVLTLKHTDVAQFLDAIKPENLPLLVHCYDGATTTGLAVACFRKQQHFAVSFIIAEFCRYTRDFNMEPEENKFLDRFRYHVEFPFDGPDWLARRTAVHPPPTPAAAPSAASSVSNARVSITRSASVVENTISSLDVEALALAGADGVPR
eukprot:m.255851 g.255851  ORF g.255851 m.255851 type:complete len:221 (+) comp19719_c0_seq1:2-664(+)